VRGNRVYIDWYYSKEGAYHNRGGYVALLQLEYETTAMQTLRNEFVTDGQRKLDENSEKIVGQFGVILVKNDKKAGEEQQNAAPEVSQEMSLKNFGLASLVNHPETAACIIDFVTYNAEHNAFTYVVAQFTMTSAGTLGSKKLDVDTILLNKAGPWVDLLDLVVLIAGVFYTLVFIQHLKNELRKAENVLGIFLKKLFGDGWNWVEAIALFGIYGSIFVYQSARMHLDTVCRLAGCDTLKLTADRWGTPFVTPNVSVQAIVNTVAQVQSYDRISGVTMLFLFVRILRSLKDAVQRIELLDTTLQIALPAMLRYLAFTGIIFFGFVNMAALSFVSYTHEFSDHPSTAATLLLMVLGKFDVMAKVEDSPLALAFFVPFMLFFYVISLQMFNAIVNQSYNKACVDLQRQFEYENIAKANDTSPKGLKGLIMMAVQGARKMATSSVSKAAGYRKKSSLTQLAGLADKKGGKRKKSGDVAKSDSRKEGSRKESSRKKDSGSGAAEVAQAEQIVPATAQQHGFFEHTGLQNLDNDTKKVVLAYLSEDKEGAKTVSNMDIVLYFVFAVSYIYFVKSFVNVGVGSGLKSSISYALRNETAGITYADGKPLFKTLDDLRSLEDLEEWTRVLFPQIVFQNVPAPLAYNPTVPSTTIAVDNSEDTPSNYQSKASARLVKNFEVVNGMAPLEAAVAVDSDTRNSLCLNGWNCVLQSKFSFARMYVYETKREPGATPFVDGELSTARQNALTGACVYESAGSNLCQAGFASFPFCFYRVLG
ncbi:unnamed protein product, partial [Amoebophrya sp. A25]